MARKAFLHLNGVTYPLVGTFNGEHDPALQDVERRAHALADGNGHVETSFDVVIDGQNAHLHTCTQGVSAAAVFVGPETGGHATVIQAR